MADLPSAGKGRECVCVKELKSRLGKALENALSGIIPNSQAVGKVGKQDSHVSLSTISAWSSHFPLSFTARLFFLLLPFVFLLLAFLLRHLS